MKRSTTLLFTFLSIQFITFAQSKFEQGYFIDNSNQKTNCLIKNEKWKNNPEEITYKLSSEAKEQTQTFKTISAFGIKDKVKYISEKVLIDKSSDYLRDLSSKEEPEFTERKLFLKVIVEGKGSLYSYKSSRLNKYFYKVENNPIEQLIYKRFEALRGNVFVNNDYKQELWTNLRCSSVDIEKYRDLEYKKKSLTTIFVSYNECNGSDYLTYNNSSSINSFNLNLRIGASFNSFDIERFRRSITSPLTADFGSQTSLRVGVELEYKLGYISNRLSLLLEPNYQYFSGDASSERGNVSVDYKTIEIAAGLRYDLIQTTKSRLYINSSFLFNASLDSEVQFEEIPDLEISEKYNFAFGLGYSFNNKYSLEFRYATTKNLLSDYSAYDSNFNTSSLIFGYNFL